MGASGAGKTSLMNAIADRIAVKSDSQLTGEIQLNDKYPLKQQLFGSCCAYVMQDDVLFHFFTVKEALTFAARLKLHSLSVEK
jgi:ABC-type multidrug transport system ATPase subunit